MQGLTRRDGENYVAMPHVTDQNNKLVVETTVGNMNSGNPISEVCIYERNHGGEYFCIQISSTENDYSEILPTFNQIKSCVLGFRNGLYDDVAIRRIIGASSSMPFIYCKKFGDTN